MATTVTSAALGPFAQLQYYGMDGPLAKVPSACCLLVLPNTYQDLQAHALDKSAETFEANGDHGRAYETRTKAANYFQTAASDTSDITVCLMLRAVFAAVSMLMSSMSGSQCTAALCREAAAISGGHKT